MTADISETETDFKIQVSLIPVRCFDLGMNKRLSHEKARVFATEALIRHLGADKRGTATIRYAEIIESGLDETRYVLVMKIPRHGVSWTESQNAKAPKSSEGKNRRSLLSAKDDFSETLDTIAETLADEIPTASENLEEFYKSVADIEELGVMRMRLFAKEVSQDRYLLATERADLLRAVDTEKEAFLRRLRKRVGEVGKLSKEAE